MLNVNPIKDGVFKYGEIDVVFRKDDLSEVTISLGPGNEIHVPGSFFQDCLNVMDRAIQAQRGDKDQASAMLLNILGTSRSLPDAEW